MKKLASLLTLPTLTGKLPPGREGAGRRIRCLMKAGAILLAVLQFSVPGAFARFPEPSHLIFGSIAVSNAFVTASQTDVIIEARTSVNGLVVASYSMGANTNVGDLYTLTLPLEDSAPLADTNSLLGGQTVYLTVRNSSAILAQVPYTLPARGGFQRVDFGTVVTNTGPLPDAWQIANFGHTGVDPNADPDGDGRSNLQEFLDGTNPNVKDNGFYLSVHPAAGQVQVSFYARAAAGSGYTNLSRSFCLEYTTNTAMPWQPITGYTNITGSNQMVIYTSPVMNSAMQFRGKQSLH